MTAVEAVNKAFSGIGHDVSINSLEEPSREARLAKRFYQLTLDTLAESWDWPFLMERVEVTVAEDGGVEIPADCIRVVALRFGDRKIEAVRRRGKLYVARWLAGRMLKLDFVSRSFEIDDTPVSFQMAFVAALGDAFVGPLVKDAEKMKLASERARLAKNRAQYDAGSGQRKPGNDPDAYIKARW